MMNRRFAHTAAATAIVLALAATPVFAGSNKQKKGEDTERFCFFRCDNNEENNKGGRFTAMGTVTAIDNTASIVTIKNADGNSVQIHVNPQTFIQLAGSKTAQKISDIKAGDWVGVNSFNTGTTVLESKRIFITRS
jgi:hypothetical protein